MERFERHDLEKKGKKPLTGMQLEKGNLPGIDTYDDGLDEDGNLVRPGSTTVESGGNYMEDTGPLSDGVRRQKIENLADNLNIIDPKMQRKEKADAAERWLQKNDPSHGKE